MAKIVAKAVSENISEISIIREVGGVVEVAPGVSRSPHLHHLLAE